jgi:hypothetical protein
VAVVCVLMALLLLFSAAGWFGSRAGVLWSDI